MSDIVEVERKLTRLPVETRARDDGQKIGGYAAMFNKLSQNLGGFVERVDPKAFNKSRGDGWPDVMARYNHDDNQLLGTTAGRTLQLVLDDQGLDYTVDVPRALPLVAELVARGDVTQSSFAFVTYEDDWGTSDQGFPMRTLLSVRLVDVAPVNSPAYRETSTGLRSLAEHVEAPLEEVRAAAEANELRKFFTRTDGPAPKPRQFGPQALLDLRAKEEPAA